MSEKNTAYMKYSKKQVVEHVFGFMEQTMVVYFRGVGIEMEKPTLH